MRQLSLTEYRTEPAVALAREERDLLRALAPSIGLAPTAGSEDRYDLTPGSTIGVIQLEDLRVEIRPKVPLDRVFFLLAYSLDPDSWREQLTRFGRAPDLLESLIPGFVYQVRRALRRGVLQGYRTEEDALPVVRGRIRFDDQIRRRYGRFPPLEVRFDEFTEDIELNRTLKAAIARLGKLRIRSSTARQSLREFDHALERVQLVEYDARQLPAFVYTRLTDHYRPAIALAQLVLKSMSLELRDGRQEGRAFMLDMNELFETFVTVSLREALGATPRSFPKNARGRRIVLDDAGRVRLRPDLSWWDGSRCLFVGDVKYKRVQVANDEIEHPDLYQLLAYSVATGLPTGVLIYAADEATPTEHEVVRIGKTLRLATIDLRGTPEAILLRVDTLAKYIRMLAAKQTMRSAA